MAAARLGFGLRRLRDVDGAPPQSPAAGGPSFRATGVATPWATSSPCCTSSRSFSEPPARPAALQRGSRRRCAGMRLGWRPRAGRHACCCMCYRCMATLVAGGMHSACRTTCARAPCVFSCSFLLHGAFAYVCHCMLHVAHTRVCVPLPAHVCTRLACAYMHVCCGHAAAHVHSFALSCAYCTRVPTLFQVLSAYTCMFCARDFACAVGTSCTVCWTCVDVRAARGCGGCQP